MPLVDHLHRNCITLCCDRTSKSYRVLLSSFVTVTCHHHMSPSLMASAFHCHMPRTHVIIIVIVIMKMNKECNHNSFERKKKNKSNFTVSSLTPRAKCKIAVPICATKLQTACTTDLNRRFKSVLTQNKRKKKCKE